jgi:hypothetical protein
MKRKEFYKVLTPLTDKLYTLAFSLLPDDLQAEQLVIDSVNAYLFKEKKWIHNKELKGEEKKELTVLRKTIFKGIIKYLGDIGVRRSIQLTELMKNHLHPPYESFFSLEPKSRLIIRLRFDNFFSVDEIADMLELPRYEVIEKIHNARFLLLRSSQVMGEL